MQHKYLSLRSLAYSLAYVQGNVEIQLHTFFIQVDQRNSLAVHVRHPHHAHRDSEDEFSLVSHLIPVSVQERARLVTEIFLGYRIEESQPLLGEALEEALLSFGLVGKSRHGINLLFNAFCDSNRSWRRSPADGHGKLVARWIYEFLMEKEVIWRNLILFTLLEGGEGGSVYHGVSAEKERFASCKGTVVPMLAMQCVDF